jgi:hypothetical protein
MDVEKTVATRLMQDTGIQAYLSVPQDTPDEFMVITQTMRTGGRFNPTYSLDVDVWGKDEHARSQTHSRAQKVIDAVPNLGEEPNIFTPKTTNVYRDPDADTGRMRYTVQIEVTVCE